MLDTTHWQSILGTKSFAGLHLSSSAISSYCCVSAHKHLQAKENTLCLETLNIALLKRDEKYTQRQGETDLDAEAIN